MTKSNLLQRVLENHNRVAQIEVHGEGAILVAETLLDLRRLLKQLQNEIVEEETSN